MSARDVRWHRRIRRIKVFTAFLVVPSLVAMCLVVFVAVWALGPALGERIRPVTRATRTLFWLAYLSLCLAATASVLEDWVGDR